MVKPKHAGGRPSSYKPEYCVGLVQHMSEGFTFDCYTEPLVSRDTLYQWAEKHKEFSDAKRLGETLCFKFWQDLGIKGTKGEYFQFNSAAWIFNMKNRFKWRDKQPDEVSPIMQVNPDNQKELNELVAAVRLIKKEITAT